MCSIEGCRPGGRCGVRCVLEGIEGASRIRGGFKGGTGGGEGGTSFLSVWTRVRAVIITEAIAEFGVRSLG